VLNAGVPSYNLRQSFDRLRLDVMRYYKKPAWVTVQAANDISLFIRYGERYTPDITWAADLKVRGTWSWVNIIALKSAIYNYAEYKIFTPPQKNHGYYPPDRMLENVKNVLDENLKFFSEQNIAVILMPADPFYYQIKNTNENRRLRLWAANGRYAEQWSGLIGQYNTMLEQTAKDNRFKNIYFFDTRRIMDETDRDAMYADFFHYSRKGNERVANALFGFLGKNGLLRARRPTETA